MQIKLNDAEMQKLKSESIAFSPEKEYSEDEALDLLELVHDKEAEYSNYPKEAAKEYQLANVFADIADKIQSQISDF